MAIIDYTSGFWMEESEKLTEEGGGVFDGHPYMNIPCSPTCSHCVHYVGHVGFAPTCNLYPKGIPPDIWLARESCEKYADSKIQTI